MTAPRLASTQADPPRGWRPGLGAARRTGANVPLVRQRVLAPTGAARASGDVVRLPPHAHSLPFAPALPAMCAQAYTDPSSVPLRQHPICVVQDTRERGLDGV